MTSRRQTLIVLAASVLTVPPGSLAQQQSKVWRVGFLLGRLPASIDADHVGGFPQGMRELGYVEGKNLMIEWRFSEEYARLGELATELVRVKVDVIVTAGNPPTGAAQKATATLPVVMANVADPVGSGFVRSLAHPGGNLTGLTNISDDISPKQLEMLLGMVPGLSRVAVLMNPANPAQSTFLKSVQAAAQKSNVKILVAEARTAQEIARAFSMMSRENAGAVIVGGDGLFLQHQRQVAELAGKHRLPSISARRENVEAGYLMSYGTNSMDIYRRAATYVDKIFKGARPADLPVEQPTKFELVINARTAKALGLTIPQSLLISADKVIE